MNGTNSHHEVLLNAENAYRGALKNVKLTADFAISADPSVVLPFPWLPPYQDSANGYIKSVNEDQWAWYCWNKDEHNRPGGAGDGNYYVPTWDFGDIPPFGSATRILKFVIDPPGITTNDPRYAVLEHSFATKADILLNRSTSLKISDWIDTVAVDTGAPYQQSPGISSDVSVFFDEETLDFGDAPFDGTTNRYPTLLAQNGARHSIDTNVYMGDLIDAEIDGIPDVAAMGDDLDNMPDEDGVITAIPIPRRATLRFTTLPAFSITNIEYSATSTTATIWWPAEDRVVYRLQYAPELATNTTVWSNIGSEVTGPANSQADPNANTSRFYRVVAPYAQ